MPSENTIIEGALRAARIVSIPVRRPDWVDPSFWAYPLNQTKTRPVPAASSWLDYLTVRPSRAGGLAPEGYSAVIKGFVATSEADPAVSGIRYRFMLGGRLLPAQEFGITDAIDRHVQRNDTYPWPAFHRRTFIQVSNNQLLTLQVRNTSGAEAVAIAGLYGWFYPNLGTLGKGGQEDGNDGFQGLEDDGR